MAREKVSIYFFSSSPKTTETNPLIPRLFSLLRSESPDAISPVITIDINNLNDAPFFTVSGTDPIRLSFPETNSNPDADSTSTGDIIADLISFADDQVSE